MSGDVQQITENLIKLQRDYASISRAIITEERYHGIIKSGLIENYSLTSEFIREPLIEHVGHLPVIATHLHQHIEHKDQVDLGEVLIMLAVHDIGETEVGDIFAFDKTEDNIEAELKAARKLLPDYLYKYFLEMEEVKTINAKFAKAVDSLAPVLHDIAMPELAQERFEIHNYNPDKIVRMKKDHFAWDKILDGIFKYLITKYDY